MDTSLKEAVYLSLIMPSQHLSSVCPLDCPDRCTLDVTVEDGRVTLIDAAEGNPVTRGFIFSKVRKFGQRLYGKERLLRPMKRVGAKGEGRFEPISWDEAIATIAGRFRSITAEHGAEAILPFYYGGSNGMISQDATDQRLFRRLGASRLLPTVCAAATGAAAEALYGDMPGIDFPDFAEARLIVIWGANPARSNIHLIPYLKEAKSRGARLILIDPRRTLGDNLVDLHLPIYPGTDLVLALAIIRWLDEQGFADRSFVEAHTTGYEALLERAREYTLERAAAISRLPADRIETLARWYAESEPALIRCGWGLERNRNGESAVAAVLALPAVAGKFGVRGGGYAMTSGSALKYDAEKVIGVPEAGTRAINMSQLGRVLTEPLDPPVKALFVYNCNPLVTMPDENRVERGLRRDDLFTVVSEQVMTDTALFADILLPATTFLEHTEVSTSYGTYGINLAEPVIEPVGEARPNNVMFSMLGRALGYNGGEFEESTQQLARRVLMAIGAPVSGDLTLDRLKSVVRIEFDFPGATPVQFETVKPGTPDARVHLFPEALGELLYRYQDDPGEEAFPLALISPATSKTISSTLGEFNLKDAALEIHPRDAKSRGLSDGDWVRVHNRLGAVEVRAEISDRMCPGVVNLPKGIWRRSTRNGSVGTSLVPDTLTPSAGGACFNDARVQVSRAATSSAS